VLLVDDEENLIQYLSKRLLKQGYTVKAAFSGEEAVKVAEEGHFDVAVVDLKMSGMDGVETQRKLKAIQPFLQCIVLTGHGSIETALECGREDAFHYLLKPVEHDDLVKAMEDAYRKKTDIQEKEFKDKVEDLYASGLGAHGIRKAMGELRKIYGIE
jgi:two-component system NtrC family response regulator